MNEFHTATFFLQAGHVAVPDVPLLTLKCAEQ